MYRLKVTSTKNNSSGNGLTDTLRLNFLLPGASYL